MSLTTRDTSTAPSSLYSSSQLHLPPSSPLFTYAPSISLPNAEANSAGWIGWYPVSDSSGVWFGWYSDTPPDISDQAGGGWVILSITNADSFIINFDLPSSGGGEGWIVKAQVDAGTPKEVESGQMVVVAGGGGKGETHDLRIQATCTGGTSGGCGSPGDPFRFNGVDIGVAVVSGSTTSSASLDDTSSLISYQGYTSSSSSSNNSSLSQSLISGSMDGTLSYTSTKGATASLAFYGSSILILGTTGPSLSTYTTSISSSSLTYNASLPLSLPIQIIGFFSGLEDSDHVLILENEVDGGGVVIDGFSCWSNSKATFGKGPKEPSPESMTTLPKPSSSTTTIIGGGFITETSVAIPIGTSGPSVGTIVGVVIGILAGIGLGIILFLYLKPKPKKPDKDFTNPADKANSLPHQENQFVQVKPRLEEESGTGRGFVHDEQGYSYPGANFKKSGGPPHSSWGR